MQKREKRSGAVYDWCESIVFSAAAAIVVLVFVFGFSQVFGSSMDPTLCEGESVLVSSFFYTPQRGDVVTTDALIEYEKPLVKRVIALEGDTVRIDGETGSVYLNGELLDEPYLPEGTLTFPEAETSEFVVPEGKVFVMGDNRDDSLDSRSDRVGFIDERDILGRVLFCVAPLSHFRRIE